MFQQIHETGGDQPVQVRGVRGLHRSQETVEHFRPASRVLLPPETIRTHQQGSK